MPEIAHHDVEDRWVVEATFKVDGTLTDPTEVSAVLRKPSGVLVTMPPGDARIDNTSTGVYLITDDCDEIGVHYLEVTGTTPAAGVERFTFVVDPRWPSDLLASHALTSIEECELILDRVGEQGSHGNEEDEKRWIANLINTFSKLVQDYAQREWLPAVQTTVVGVNALDSATVNVASTVGFPSSGSFALGVDTVTYTGTTATSFTGCSAHAATTGSEPVDLLLTRRFLYDGDGILSLAPFEARDISAVTLYANVPAEQRPVESELEEGYSLLGNSWYGEPYTMTESNTWIELQIPRRGHWCQVDVAGKWGAGVVPDTVRHVVEAEVANTYWASRVRSPIGPNENFLVSRERQIGETGYALDPRSMRILDGFRNVSLV